MTIHDIEAGPYQTMGYIVSDDAGDALIIDVPLDSSKRMLAHLSAHALTATAIVLTHGHFDHVGEVRALSEALQVPVLIHEGDAGMLEKPMALFAAIDLHIEGMTATRFLRDDEKLSCGSLTFQVLHVPGHSPGHVALYEQSQSVLFSGDVLFNSSIGRTDLPGGDYDSLMHSISHRLLTLPDGVVVYPGHGSPTTIGFEREHNPFILDYYDHF